MNCPSVCRVFLTCSLFFQCRGRRLGEGFWLTPPSPLSRGWCPTSHWGGSQTWGSVTWQRSRPTPSPTFWREGQYAYTRFSSAFSSACPSTIIIKTVFLFMEQLEYLNFKKIKKSCFWSIQFYERKCTWCMQRVYIYVLCFLVFQHHRCSVQLQIKKMWFFQV